MENQIFLTSIPVDQLKADINRSVVELLHAFYLSKVQNAPPALDHDKLIKISDVMKLLRVSKMTVHQWRKQGKLPYYRIGRLIFFKEHEVINSMKRIENAKKRGVS